MESWRRRQGGEFRDREVRRVRSDYSRPAQQEMQESSVPTWEKKFCFLVGGMPWNKFLESKRYVLVSDTVVEWDDSAGEEAFNNAKSRFWAKINRLPCDILPPDPDANIDAVDWDSAVDLDLYLELELELERLRKPLQEEQEEVEEEGAPPALEEPKRCYLLTREELLLEMKVEPTGWGDEADAANPPQSDDWENKAVVADRQVNEWGSVNDDAGSRFPAAGNYGLQGDRRYRRRGRNANAARHKYPLRQWNMKPSAQV